MQILFRKLPFGFALAYLPKPLASFCNIMDEIDLACHVRRAIFLKIEPDVWDGSPPPTLRLRSPVPAALAQANGAALAQAGQAGEGAGVRISPHNIQPPRTVLIDLRGSEERILARMKQKTRYNVRLAEKKGVRVRPWDDLPAFHQMMLLTGGRDGFGVHSLEYYHRAYDLFHPTGMCELLAAEFEGKPLAALMVFARGRRAWYVYGASSDEERNRMPTYLLQWEAMRWAKARGCEEYDLWGAPDEDEETLEANFEKRRDGLWGVYRFKRGFGGQLKRAAQALDRVYMPLLYRLYLGWMRKREAS